MDEIKEKNSVLNLDQNESIHPGNNKAVEQIFLETPENKSDDETHELTNHHLPKKSYKTQETIPRELLRLCIDMDWCREKKEIKKLLKSDLMNHNENSDSYSDNEDNNNEEESHTKNRDKELTNDQSKLEEKGLDDNKKDPKLLELSEENQKYNKEQDKKKDKDRDNKLQSSSDKPKTEKSKSKENNKDMKNEKSKELKVKKDLSKNKTDLDKIKDKSKFKELVKGKKTDKKDSSGKRDLDKSEDSKSEKRKLDAVSKKKMDSDTGELEMKDKKKQKKESDNKESKDKNKKKLESKNKEKESLDKKDKDKEKKGLNKEVKRESSGKENDSEVVDPSLFTNYVFDYEFMLNPKNPFAFYRIQQGKEVTLFDLIGCKFNMVRSTLDVFKGIFVVNNVTDYGMVSYSPVNEGNKNALSKYISVDKSQPLSESKESSLKYDFNSDDGPISCLVFEDIALYVNDKNVDLCVIIKNIATDNYEFDSRRNRSSLMNNLGTFKVFKISCNIPFKKARYLLVEERRKKRLKEKRKLENKSKEKDKSENGKNKDNNKDKEKDNELSKHSKKEFGEYWYLRFLINGNVVITELRRVKHASKIKVYEESLIPKNRNKISILRNIIASVLNFQKHKESKKNNEQVKELPIQLCVRSKEQKPSFNECNCLCCKITVQLLTVNSMYIPNVYQKIVKFKSNDKIMAYKYFDVLNQTLVSSSKKDTDKSKETDSKTKESKDKEDKGTPKNTYSRSPTSFKDLSKELKVKKEKENNRVDREDKNKDKNKYVISKDKDIKNKKYISKDGNKYKDNDKDSDKEDISDYNYTSNYEDDTDEDYDDLTLDSVHRITRRMVKELHSVECSPVRKNKDDLDNQDRVNEKRPFSKITGSEVDKSKDIKDKDKYDKIKSESKSKDKDKDRDRDSKVQSSSDYRESLSKKKLKSSNEYNKNKEKEKELDEKLEKDKIENKDNKMEKGYPGSGRQVQITDCNSGFIYVGCIVKYSLIDKETNVKNRVYNYAVIKFWDPKFRAFFVHELNEEITKTNSDIQIYRNYLTSSKYQYQDLVHWITTQTQNIITIGDKPVFDRLKVNFNRNLLNYNNNYYYKDRNNNTNNNTNKDNKEMNKTDDTETKTDNILPTCRICNKKILYIRKEFSKLPEMWDKDNYDDELTFSDFISEYLSTYDYPNLLFRNPVHSTILSLRELEQLGFGNVIKLLENNLDITTMFFKGYERASINIYSKLMLYTCVKLIWWIRKYSGIRERLYKKSPLKLVYWGFKCSTCNNHYHAKCLQYQHLRKPPPKMDKESVISRFNVHKTMCRNFKVVTHMRTSYYSNENLFWTTDFKLNLDPRDDIYPEQYFHFPVKIMDEDEYLEESNMDLSTILKKYRPNRTYNDNDRDRNICVKLLVESMEELPPESENSKFYMFYPLLDCTEESNNWSCSDCRVCMYCCLPIQPNLHLNRFNYGYGFSDSSMKSYKQFPPCFEEKVDHLQRNCLQTDKVRHVVCVSCNVSAHRRCCNPVIPNLLFIESWKCDSCTQCISCGYRDPSYVEYLNWGLFFFFCLKCWELLERSNYCGICYKVWTNFDTSSQKWVQCEGCKLWIHVECDDLARLITECPSSRNQNYRCYVCRSPDKILRCMKLLEQIFVIDKLNQFRYPVSPNFITYWRLVTKPMNLVMLLTKLEGGKYVSFTEFIFDTFLIPYNAKMVNMPNTKIYRFAIIFERKLRQLVTSIMQIDGPEIDAIVNAGINGGDFLTKEKLLLGGTKETLDSSTNNEHRKELGEQSRVDVDSKETDYNEGDVSKEERDGQGVMVTKEKDNEDSSGKKDSDGLETSKQPHQRSIDNYRSQVIKFNFTFEFIISKILNIDIKLCHYAPPQAFKDNDSKVSFPDPRLAKYFKSLQRSKPLNYRLVGRMFETFVPCGLNYVSSSVVSVSGTPFIFPPMFNDKEDFLQLVRSKNLVMMNKNQPRNPYFEFLVQKIKGVPTVGVYEFYIDKPSDIDNMSKMLFNNGFLQFNDVCVVCGSNSFQSYLIYCEECAEPMHYYCAGFMFPPKFMNYKRFKCAGCTRCERCQKKVCCNHPYDLSNINNFHFGDALGFVPTLITNIVLYSAQILAEASMDQQAQRTESNMPLNQLEYERLQRDRCPKFATFLDGRFRVDHNGLINSTSDKDFTHQSKFPLNTVRCIGCGNSAHLSCVKIINPPTNPFSPYSKFSKSMNSEKSEGLFDGKTVDWSLNFHDKEKKRVGRRRSRYKETTDYNEGDVSKEDQDIDGESYSSSNEFKENDFDFRKNIKDFKQDPHKYFKRLLLARSDLLRKEENNDQLNESGTNSNVVNLCINYLNENENEQNENKESENKNELFTKRERVSRRINRYKNEEIYTLVNKESKVTLTNNTNEQNKEENEQQSSANQLQDMKIDLNQELNTHNGKIDMKYVLLLAKKLSLCDDLIRMIQVHMESSPNNKLYMANGAPSIYNYMLNHDSKVHNHQNGNKKKQQILNDESKEVTYLNGNGVEKERNKQTDKIECKLNGDEQNKVEEDMEEVEIAEHVDEEHSNPSNHEDNKEQDNYSMVKEYPDDQVNNNNRDISNNEHQEDEVEIDKDNKKLNQLNEHKNNYTNVENNCTQCEFGHVFKELETNKTQGTTGNENEVKIVYDKSSFIPEPYLNWEFDGSGLFTCTQECQQNYYKLKDFNYSHELLFSNSLAMQFDVLQENYNLLPIESKEISVEFHLRSITNGLKAQEKYEANRLKIYKNMDRDERVVKNQENGNNVDDKDKLEEHNGNRSDQVYISNHCALCGKTMKRPVEMKTSQKIISNNEKTELLLPNSVTNWIMCSHCSFYRKYMKMVSKKIKETIENTDGLDTTETSNHDTDSFLFVPENYQDSVLSTISCKHFTNLLSVARKWMLTSENLVNYLITLVSTLVPKVMSNANLKRVVYTFLKRVDGSLINSYVYNAMISSPLSPVVFTNWKKTLLNYHLMDFDIFSGKMEDSDNNSDNNFEIPMLDDEGLDYIHHNPKHRTTRMNLSYFIMIKRYTELVSQSSRLFWTYRDLLSYKIFFKNLGFTRRFDKSSPYYKYNKRSIALLSTRLQKLFYHIINGDIYCDKWSQKLKHRFPYLRKHMAHLILNGDVNWYKDAETNPNSPWLVHYSRIDGGTTSPSYILGRISYEAEAILSILSEFIKCSSTPYRPVRFRRENINGVQNNSNISIMTNGTNFNSTQNQSKVDEATTEGNKNKEKNKIGETETNRDNTNKEDKIGPEQQNTTKPMSYKRALAELRKLFKTNMINPRARLQESITLFDSKFYNKSIFNFDMEQLYRSLQLVKEKINEQSKMDRLETFLYENIGSSLLVDVVSARAITGDIAIGDRLTTNEAVTEFTANQENIIKPAMSIHLKMFNYQKNSNRADENVDISINNVHKNKSKNVMKRGIIDNGFSLIDACCLCGITKNTLLRGSLLPWRNGYVHSECLLWSVSDVYLPRTYNFNYDSFYTLFERKRKMFVGKLSTPMFGRKATNNQKKTKPQVSRKTDGVESLDKSMGLKKFKGEDETDLAKFNQEEHVDGDDVGEREELEQPEDKEEQLNNEEELDQLENENEELDDLEEVNGDGELDDNEVDMENELYEQNSYPHVDNRYGLYPEEYEGEDLEEVEIAEHIDEEHSNPSNHEDYINQDEDESNSGSKLSGNKETLDNEVEDNIKDGNEDELELERETEDNSKEDDDMDVDSNGTDYNEGDVSKEEQDGQVNSYLNKEEATTEGGDETFQGPPPKVHKKPTVYFTFPEPEPDEANINLMYLPVLPPVQIPDSAVDRVYKLSLSNTCSWCNTFGASVKCAGYYCNVSFHLSCAFESSNKLVHLLYERDVKEQEYSERVFPVKMFYTRRKIWCASCFERIENNLKNFHLKRLTNRKKTDLKIFFSLEGISSNAVKIVSRQTLQSVRIIPRQVDYNRMDNFLNLNACSYGHTRSSYTQTMFNNPLEPTLSEFISNVFRPDFKTETTQKIYSEYDFVNKFYLYGADKNLSSPFSNRIHGLCYPKEVTHNAFRVGSVTVLNIGEALLQDKRGVFYPIGFTTVRKFWNSNYFNSDQEQVGLKKAVRNNKNGSKNGRRKKKGNKHKEDKGNVDKDSNGNKDKSETLTNNTNEQNREENEENKSDESSELNQDESHNEMEVDQLEDKEGNGNQKEDQLEKDEQQNHEIEQEEDKDKNVKLDAHKHFGNTNRSYYLCSIRCLDGMPYFTMDLLSPPNSNLPNKRISEGSNIYEVFDIFKDKLGLESVKMNVETFFGLNLNIVLQQMRYELGYTMLKRATQFCKISAFKKSVFGTRFNNYDLTMRLGEPKTNLPYRFNKVMTLSNITTTLDFNEQGQTDVDLTDNRLNRSRQRKQFDMSNTSTQYRYLLSFPAERRLDVKPSVIHGLGLFANEFIPAGEPVVEYVGELIRDVIGDQREEVYSENQGGDGSCYMFRLDEQLIVDATNKGNMSRFINHSCDPNCLCRIITCENGLKHIVVFAKTDLNPGDEVTYDYQFGVESETRKLTCLCGAANCLGRMN